MGWGEVMNGGFGLLLDGTDDAAGRARNMLTWDVANGVSRRSWARNENAEFAIRQAMAENPMLKVTLPVHVSEAVLAEALAASLTE